MATEVDQIAEWWNNSLFKKQKQNKNKKQKTNKKNTHLQPGVIHFMETLSFRHFKVIKHNVVTNFGKWRQKWTKLPIGEIISTSNSQGSQISYKPFPLGVSNVVKKIKSYDCGKRRWNQSYWY